MTLLSPLVGALAGALFGTIGSYYVLLRLAPRQQRLAELRQEFFDFLPHVTEYWTAPTTAGERALREARILAQQEILKTKFHDMARDRRLARAYQTSSSDRIALWDAAAGVPFQSGDWQPDPSRPTRAVAAVAAIISKLPP